MKSSSRRYFEWRPPAPMTLLALLQEIFPQFGDEEIAQEVEESEVGLHCLMRNFTEYFGSLGGRASEEQLRALAALLDEAVSVDDVLENAVSTCLLEHLGQIDRLEALRPYISRAALVRTSPWLPAI